MHLEPERHRSPSISLTPLIDVVFILLVFFMLATRFGEWKDLPVNVLSSEASEQSNDKQWLTLTVTADGQVEMEGRTLPIDELTAALEGHSESVLISGDPAAPVQAALATLDAARAAGLEDVQLELMP
ncbi:biopolymer transporter ExbD (plasmid) [Alcanivorax sp. N3-2A]|nr:biopolymer transporter ExbD [Alcanivorax sp. N3-2A]ASK36900.1 biopolymer transporter ExbD [Alcanivorax sp. N3-2A]|tara:strand:- start:4114 stop:4497 length:384 start_codon:yes stop_codon:yes gene_type:complete